MSRGRIAVVKQNKLLLGVGALVVGYGVYKLFLASPTPAGGRQAVGSGTSTSGPGTGLPEPGAGAQAGADAGAQAGSDAGANAGAGNGGSSNTSGIPGARVPTNGILQLLPDSGTPTPGTNTIYRPPMQPVLTLRPNATIAPPSPLSPNLHLSPANRALRSTRAGAMAGARRR